MGVLIAITIILLWAAHLAWMLLRVPLSWDEPVMYLHILVQAYLYTGLFITGHDAMHGNISPRRWLNETLGHISVSLFAGLSYKKLKKNHGRHHKFVASENDPDFYVPSQNYFRWLGAFMWRYLSIQQLIIMAVAYNLLLWVIPGATDLRILIFWALPAILGTLQLFTVGVFWPHRLPHTPSMGRHKARTQIKNHFWAMLSCYFFGYHSEHHDNPRIAWWQLYRSKS